jgi:hypothetical protein
MGGAPFKHAHICMHWSVLPILVFRYNCFDLLCAWLGNILLLLEENYSYNNLFVLNALYLEELATSTILEGLSLLLPPLI